MLPGRFRRLSVYAPDQPVTRPGSAARLVDDETLNYSWESPPWPAADPAPERPGVRWAQFMLARGAAEHSEIGRPAPPVRGPNRPAGVSPE